MRLLMRTLDRIGTSSGWTACPSTFNASDYVGTHGVGLGADAVQIDARGAAVP